MASALDVMTRGKPFPTPRPTARELPYEDGEPMDSPWHLHNMNLLIDLISTRWRGRDDFYTGGNMFVYFGDREVFNKDFRGPDFFVVNGGVERYKERLSWVAWEENGRLPDVIVELASKSTIETDRVIKKAVYSNRMRCREYFIYDPLEDRLEGWRLGPGYEYLSIDPDDDDRLWSEVLGCWFGTWDGVYYDDDARWLRMFEPDGTLAPTRLEVAAAALRENRRLVTAELTARQEAERRAAAEATARQEADQRAAAEETARRAAEEEIARLRAELAALRGTPPTNP